MNKFIPLILFFVAGFAEGSTSLEKKNGGYCLNNGSKSVLIHKMNPYEKKVVFKKIKESIIKKLNDNDLITEDIYQKIENQKNLLTLSKYIYLTFIVTGLSKNSSDSKLYCLLPSTSYITLVDIPTLSNPSKFLI